MKDKDGIKLKIGDPILVDKSDHSGILSGHIKGFSKQELCCHVLCGGEIYKGIYSKELTFWE